MPSPPRVRCRQIEASDLEAVTDLLTRGFPARSRKYWTNGLARLQALSPIEGCPRFGYLLEADGVVVGAVLLIFTAVGAGPRAHIRCNAGSLYVEPAFRGHAALLVSAALKLKHVTYTNTTARTFTWPMLQAQGYRRYTEGQFAAVPALSARSSAIAATAFSEADRDLPDFDLVKAHVDAGCAAIVCRTADGPFAFVFVRRRIVYAPFGVMQLIYCKGTESFVRCAGAIGRLLLRRGVICVLCDAEAPIPGLVGRFFKDKMPRFFKGPDRPRANDLAFTELVLFGP